jgi:omega-6 fatty acid desaturase (delta-12 desaturase)
MRTCKALVLASKAFIREDRWRSWLETCATLVGICALFSLTFLNFHLSIRLVLSCLCGLFYVRMFIIYHDYQHHAILQGSVVAKWVMKIFGVFILAPQTIWKRSHDHHHTHNSKLTMHGIGSYPTISKNRYLLLTGAEQRLYLLNRHPLTVIFGYFTLFIYWLNVKSFLQSPAKHMDSLLSLVLHIAGGAAVFYWFGLATFIISWLIPFFIAFFIGSYLFYCQHNFPSAKFCENHDWKYDQAAIASTSFMAMPRVMHWFTGNIGYHHVHHLNSRIPFYRLPESMKSMPELWNVPRTSWNPLEMWRCFQLKLWDADRGKMITLYQAFHADVPPAVAL